MNVWYANMRSETLKLLLRGKYTLFLAVAALLPIASALLLRLADKTLLAPFVTGSNLGLLTLLVSGSLLLPLTVVMSALDLFTAERENRTATLVLVRPISRFKVYASKMAAIGLVALLFWAVGLVSAYLSSGLIVGAWTGFPWLDYVLVVPPLLVLGTFAAWLSQWFKSTTGAFAVILLLYAAYQAGPFLFPSLDVLFTSGAKWHTLKAESLVLWSGMAVCFLSGYLTFDSKEW